MTIHFEVALIQLIDPLHDDVKNQNKPGALCIVGFIGGPLSDNILTPAYHIVMLLVRNINI